MNEASIAKIAEFSLSTRRSEDCFGTLWHYFVKERSNSALGAPLKPYYCGRPSSPRLVIGLDTEYAPVDKLTNRILSYQFFASTPDAEWLGIFYPTRKRRIKLARYIGSIIKIGQKEGLIKGWPEAVYCCGHFTLADFTAFEDMGGLCRKMDSVRRTFLSLAKPIKITCYDASRHKHKVKVHVRDSMVLAPNGMGSLKSLGDILGFEKQELDEGMIEHMDEFLKSDPERFETYALRDAEIAARYCAAMAEINLDLLGTKEIPFTLSSLGISLLLKSWQENGMRADDILGKETVPDEQWNGHYMVKTTKRVSRSEVHMWESFVTETYHGGRNEQYLFGAGRKDEWCDWDLCGAYTTAMALLGMPDWTRIRHTRDVSEYQPTALGFSRVQFKFPPDTRFPCLPVRCEAGLIFPLEGESLCGSPEIYLAVKMGATVHILDGIIVPQDLTVRPFANFIRLATMKRKEHPKGSLYEQAWKELSNATYGKTAQGLREKRCYSSREDKYDRLPPSRITNPFFASWVTSFVRAVLGEILASLPSHVMVSNATTDGLLCTASKAEMDLCTSGTLCTLFTSGRYLVAGKRECVDSKHSIDQVLGMRTRGQLTLLGATEEDLVLAKAGVKPPVKGKEAQNEWMIDLFLRRDSKTQCTVKYLRSLADICRKGGDLTPKEITRTVRLDYDWKRRPVEVSTIPIRGVDHIAFQTMPWRTVDEALACRRDWSAFIKSDNRVLRSEEDLAEFESYRTMEHLTARIRRPRKGGTRKLAARQFLRAFVRSMAGLGREEMSYRELAEFITRAGVPTSKADVENAARTNAALEPHSVPRIPAVLDFFEAIKERFPGFDGDFLLVPSPEMSQRENAAHERVQQPISLPPSLI